MFTLFVNFFMKTLIKSIIYCQAVSLHGPFAYVCCENCMSGSSAFVLNLGKSCNILCRMLNGNCPVQLSIIVIGRRNKSLAHALRVIVAVELHVNATYHAQHPALKSVLWKRPISNSW